MKLKDILLKKFCYCASLRTGTLVAGIAGIVLAIIGIIVIWSVSVEIKTIVLDWLPKLVVKIIITVNFLMTILISTLLIIGTVKRNMYLMLPWIVLGLMLSVGLLVSIIYTSVNFFIDDKVLDGALWLGVGIPSFIVYVYMWWVAFSFFMEIREEAQRGAYTKDPFRRHY